MRKTIKFLKNLKKLKIENYRSKLKDENFSGLNHEIF